MQLKEVLTTDEHGLTRIKQGESIFCGAPFVCLWREWKKPETSFLSVFIRVYPWFSSALFRLSGFRLRQFDPEFAPFADFRFHSDPATHAFNGALDNGQ